MPPIPVLAGVTGVLLLTGVLHGAFRALAAWLCGDRRPEIRERISLNPVRHGHWFATLILPLLTYLLIQWPIGGPTPAHVDEDRLGPGRLALVALGGVFGIVLAGALFFATGAGLVAGGVIDDVDLVSSDAWQVINVGLSYAVFILVLHLVPIPPTDGSRVVAALLPGPLRRVYQSVAPVGPILTLLFALWVTDALHYEVRSIPRGYGRELRRAQNRLADGVLEVADALKGR